MSHSLNAVLDHPGHADDIALELERLNAKLDRMTVAIEQLDRRREELEELVADTMPAVNGAITLAIAKLAELEKSETPARLIRAATALTTPEITSLAERSVGALTSARRGKPPSLWQLLRARKEPRVRRGIAAMLEVLRVIGEGGHTQHPAKVIRTSAPAPTKSPAPVHCPAPAAPAVAVHSRPIAGKVVRVDAEGFMVDRDAWSREIGEALAAEVGIAPLTPKHWQVIEFCRQDAAETGASPGMRRITTALGIAPKEMYALFPKGPGILAARVAGLSKPKSCV